MPVHVQVSVQPLRGSSDVAEEEDQQAAALLHAALTAALVFDGDNEDANESAMMRVILQGSRIIAESADPAGCAGCDDVMM